MPKKRDTGKFLSEVLEMPDPYARLLERKQRNRKMRTFADEMREMQLRTRLRNEFNTMRSYYEHSTIPQNRRNEIGRVIQELEYALQSLP